jgi:hypothetical protein
VSMVSVNTYSLVDVKAVLSEDIKIKFILSHYAR